MLSVHETNVRVSRTEPSITRRCASQHPGQSNDQVRNTKGSPTLMPAIASRVADFHAGDVGEAHGYLMSFDDQNR